MVTEVFGNLSISLEAMDLRNFFVKDINIFEELKDIPPERLGSIKRLVKSISANPTEFYPKNVDKITDLLKR